MAGKVAESAINLDALVVLSKIVMAVSHDNWAKAFLHLLAFTAFGKGRGGAKGPGKCSLAGMSPLHIPVRSFHYITRSTK